MFSARLFRRFIPSITCAVSGWTVYDTSDFSSSQKCDSFFSNNQGTVFQSHEMLNQGMQQVFRPMLPIDHGTLRAMFPKSEQIASDNHTLRQSSAFIFASYSHEAKEKLEDVSVPVVSSWGNGTFVSPHLILTAFHTVSPYVLNDKENSHSPVSLDEEKKVIGPSRYDGIVASDLMDDDAGTGRFKEIPRTAGCVWRNGEHFQGSYEIVAADSATDIALIRVDYPSDVWVEIAPQPEFAELIYWIGFRQGCAPVKATDGVPLNKQELSMFFGSEFDVGAWVSGNVQIPAISMDVRSAEDVPINHKIAEQFWDAEKVPEPFRDGTLLVDVPPVTRYDRSVAKAQVAHLLGSTLTHSGIGICGAVDGKTIFAVHHSHFLNKTTGRRYNQATVVSETDIYSVIEDAIRHDIAEYRADSA